LEPIREKTRISFIITFQENIMFILRILYFLLIGWWLSLILGFFAYLCCLTIVGIPIGTYIFNRYPKILTLKPTKNYIVEGKDVEINFFLRAIYFFLVGWWLGLLALKVGWILCITIIGMPLGVFILNRIPFLMTLKLNF